MSRELNKNNLHACNLNIHLIFFKFKKLIKNATNYVLNKNSLIKSKPVAAIAEVDFALKSRALGIG